MALYAFDGTGNEDRDSDYFDSNVALFFQAYNDPDKNDDPSKMTGSLYLKGIGTRARTFLGRGFSEAFGIGGHSRIRQAFDRLENNVEAGDSIVDIAGFSRAGALAISFANEIAGKIKNIDVRFMALFDVVGEFGMPGEHVNAGHNLQLPPNAQHICHAMALDETRLLYPLTRLGFTGREEGRLQEVWFRGTHSDVGGGNANRGLNSIALDWMFTNARRFGVPVREEDVAANAAHKAEARQVSSGKVDLEVVRRVRDSDLIHVSVVSQDGSFVGGPPLAQTISPTRLVDENGNLISQT